MEMKKVMALLFLSFAMSLTSCNDEEEIDVPVLVDALDRGLIVRIDDDDTATVDGKYFGLSGLIPVTQASHALVECPPAPFDPETYWWICRMSHPNGHAIANGSASPTIDDFAVYEESPSEEYPTDMTFSIYFSQKPEHYPHHAAAPYQALRGLIVAWGVQWRNARENRCNSPVWAPYCNQE
jgi:hypothetical protein